MTPHAALMHLSLHRSAVGDRLGQLTVCPACRAALLDELDSHFPSLAPPITRTLAETQIMVTQALEGSQIMGFTFSEGPRETCALHALLHEGDAHG